MMLALLVVVAVAAAHPVADPASDPAADPAADPAGDAAGEWVAETPAPRRVVVVAPLEPLGVDDAVAAAATAELLKQLQKSLVAYDVSDAAPAVAARAAACRDDACFDAIAGVVGAVAVVHGSVQRVGGGLVVVVDAGHAHAVGSAVEAAAGLAQNFDAQTPTATPPTPPTTTTTPTPTPTPPPTMAQKGKTGPPHDDQLLLLLDYGLLIVGGFLPGGFLLLPVVQGLLHNSGGEELVGNTYPRWTDGVIAGYVVFGAAAAVVLGGYVAAIAAGGSEEAGLIALGGFAVGLVLVAAEPAVVWSFARADAVAVE